MAPFDFDAERKKIVEYESRTEPEERRGPTRSLEKPEQEWAMQVKEHIKKVSTSSCPLSNDQIRGLKDTEISEKQIRWHEENKQVVEEDDRIVDEDGKTVAFYLAHGMSLPWDADTAREITETLEKATEEFIDHYPPPPPQKDKRFQAEYEKDKERCQKFGFQIGVHHLGYRREKGNPQQIPGFTDETVGSVHQFIAVDKLYRALTLLKQTIGMVYSIACPEEYAEAQKNRATLA